MHNKTRATGPNWRGSSEDTSQRNSAITNCGLRTYEFAKSRIANQAMSPSEYEAAILRAARWARV